MLSEIRRTIEATESYAAYVERHNIRSAANLTVTDAEIAALIAERLAPRIAGRTVVEIGGGIGLLSLYMGTVARRVYCIEAKPMWAMVFTEIFLGMKPKHVSYIFGAADEFVGCIKADVAVICTHSDIEGLKLAGRQLATEVIDVYGEMIEANPQAFDPLARQMRPFA
jgi:predicted RNA methylase